MIRRVRMTGMTLALALIAAGCAQTSGTYVTGDGARSPLDTWPTPTLTNSPAPTPPEPTLLPQATIPVDAATTAESQAAAEPSRRAVTPRRAAAAPRAPTTATPAVASVVPRDVWQRVRGGFQMRGTGDPSLVGDWESYYASRADYFARMIDNSGHFLYHIANEVEKRGMPMEIALLPMIESAYNPVAYSSAHASGIWQFIPSTGKNYGLKQNGWYDGRRDVIAATGAALDYLQMLYGMFNDWELALAAYNWGEGAVQRAIDRNQAKGLPTDYLSLAAGMPAETRNYLPKLLAVKNIIDNPARFGLNLAHVPNEPYFEVVSVTRHIDVTVAARFAGMTIEEFKFLNPAHNKPVINSNSAETIVLPRQKVETFLASMNQHHDKPLVSMKTHTVRAGELPQSIAGQYGISVAQLNSLNGIGPRRRITTGQTLMVPNQTDLQPSLDDIPLATTLARAVTRPNTRAVMQKVVVTRGGVRRTVMVAVPAHIANVPRAPVRAAVNARNAGARGRVATPVRSPNTAKPAVQKIVYTAPQKNKSR